MAQEDKESHQGTNLTHEWLRKGKAALIFNAFALWPYLKAVKSIIFLISQK